MPQDVAFFFDCQPLHLSRLDAISCSKRANRRPLPSLADAPAESHEAGRQRPDDGRLRQQAEIGLFVEHVSRFLRD